MSAERHRAPRYQFIADAEVDEIQSETKFRAKTGGISLGGCFPDLLNPAPDILPHTRNGPKARGVPGPSAILA